MVIQSAEKEDYLKDQVSVLTQKLKDAENQCEELTREKAQLKRQIDTLESEFSHVNHISVDHSCVAKNSSLHKMAKYGSFSYLCRLK